MEKAMTPLTVAHAYYMCEFAMDCDSCPYRYHGGYDDSECADCVKELRKDVLDILHDYARMNFPMPNSNISEWIPDKNPDQPMLPTFEKQTPDASNLNKYLIDDIANFIMKRRSK